MVMWLSVEKQTEHLRKLLIDAYTRVHSHTLTYCKDCSWTRQCLCCPLPLLLAALCTLSIYLFLPFFLYFFFVFAFSLVFVAYFRCSPFVFVMVEFFLALIVGFIVVIALIPLSAPLSVSTAVVPITSVFCVHTLHTGVGMNVGKRWCWCVYAYWQLVIKDRQLSTLLTAIRVQFVKQNYCFLILNSLLFCAA